MTEHRHTNRLSGETSPYLLQHAHDPMKWSHTLGAPIALGYVRREHFEPGRAVSVRDGDASLPARVAALPFVPPSGPS